MATFIVKKSYSNQVHSSVPSLYSKEKEQVEQLANIMSNNLANFPLFPPRIKYTVQCICHASVSSFCHCHSKLISMIAEKAFWDLANSCLRKRRKIINNNIVLLFFLFLNFFYYFNTFLMKTIYLWTLNSDVCSIYWTNFLRNIMNENSLIIPPFWETIFYSIYKAIYVQCEHNRDLIQVFIFMPCVFILFFS